jgi:hypothetical protein
MVAGYQVTVIGRRRQCQIRDELAAVGVAGMLAKRLGVLPREIKVIPAIEWTWKAPRQATAKSER